jgi:hypothetical protein
LTPLPECGGRRVTLATLVTLVTPVTPVSLVTLVTLVTSRLHRIEAPSRAGDRGRAGRPREREQGGGWWRRDVDVDVDGGLASTSTRVQL